MSQLWQHPYVNVFKHFNVSTWKKSTKEGEVAAVMDKSVKGTVYRISGAIPAGNFIQLPKTGSQCLGLTGRYLYLLFRPVPAKYFVAHIDVATQDNLIVRVSFSNLFKEFKSTSTWLQFPFVCNVSGGSVHAYAAVGSRDHTGPAPLSARWTVLCLDLQYILSMYLNRKYSYVKSVRLCANMLVKNVMTSDVLYDPGITFEESKKRGLTSQGIMPMPREMAYPLFKGDNWHDHYDLIRFPTDNNNKMKPFDSIQMTDTQDLSSDSKVLNPKRVPVRTVDVSKCVSERVSMIHKLTSPKEKVRKRAPITTDLPEIGLENLSLARDTDVHVYAHPEDDVLVPRAQEVGADNSHNNFLSNKPSCRTLEPDPILKLKRIVGFGGSTYREAVWSADGTTIVYPCHSVLVAMKVNNGHQRFFLGHTEKISCLSMNSSSSLIASGQTGQMSVVRIWKFRSGECLSMCKTHVHSLSCLSFSQNGNVLCGVGKDGHGKNMIVIWNTSRVTKSREVTVVAKAHTDVDIVQMKIAAFDDTRMVSCGRDNIRLWRVKEGSLRSAPVSLGEYNNIEFTDVSFDVGYRPSQDLEARSIYACSRSGHVFEIDYQKVSLRHVRRLLPTERKSSRGKESFKTGIGINSLCVNETFCVTGSDDGFLRLWPLDFANVYLEAEHEGPVTAVNMSPDGLKILAGTSVGNLGVLDVSTRAYSTMMRSHTARIRGIAVDPYRKHLATVSDDHSIRVWDAETLQQLYDFSTPSECPCAISYHPSRQIFACGFENGVVRVFNVQTTSMLAEHKLHRGKVTGLIYSPSGDNLYSCCSLGSIAVYDASTTDYRVIRALANTAARGEHHGPDAIAISPDSRRVAFVGPSDFTITVVDAKCLDEVLRVDITSMNTTDSSRSVLDSAIKVCFTPSVCGHLLVTTSSNKLLKLDSRTGKLLAEISDIHRSGCSSLAVSDNGKYLATTGDKVIKIWQYGMNLDINFQVFIGHSEKISKILFTPDGLGLLTAGEAIYVWDFLAARPPTPTEGRHLDHSNNESRQIDYSSQHLNLSTSYTDLPRRSPPKPTRQAPDGFIDDLSSIHKFSTDADVESDREEVLVGPELGDYKDSDDESPEVGTMGQEILGKSPNVREHRRQQVPVLTPVKPGPLSPSHVVKKPAAEDRSPPCVHKHFTRRKKIHTIAQRRYIAPPNQAGLKLKSVIGYNGNGRNNMVWQPDYGLFVYTSGCIVIIEDLNNGQQKHLQGHTEEISCLTLQNDCQMLASSSGSFGLSESQICIWDLKLFICKKVISHHEHDIVCLAYSRDDRFLISVGDYQECSLVVWSTTNYDTLSITKTAHPIHDLKWDPFTMNEFASVGANGNLLFWLLDETSSDVCLNVHEADVPEELLQMHHMGAGQVDFTSLVFAGDSTMYAATNHGRVSAWDTRCNTCFMHWEADSTEIGQLVSCGNRLLTGSVGQNVRLWSTVGVGEMRLPGENNSIRVGGLTMEDEMTLDGAICSVSFDDCLEMGIVGTSAGTLWYINWSERTSVRLVSGHMNKVNGLTLTSGGLLSSCADDGSVRVWSVHDREQTLQFQVVDQACTCISFAPDQPAPHESVVSSSESEVILSHRRRDSKLVPYIAAGYSDGTVRMFDVNKAEMVLKMHPHAVAVTAVSFSSDGRMILSGGSDGLIAVSSPTTGMTVRVVGDHKGAVITNIDVTFRQDQDFGISAPLLWLACSADRRVSVWSADWSTDFCELVDWLTFPAPAFAPDGSILEKHDKSQYSTLPPSLAKFSTSEPDIIVYTGYGMNKCLQFYSLSQRKVVRTTSLTQWTLSLDLAKNTTLIAMGASERLLKLMEYSEGSF
ncbi:WD repeat-containing protein 90-like isoform X2 [Gigantopelta aegis]|nr:WD repeat-containing protein 90-like isoform X2 [Gigantopelta aegis]